uniref:Uncharacterized protein n=1 Tax=Anopheles farauti TaxID=69004 RepID=A0A182Q7X8_9DIPT
MDELARQLSQLSVCNGCRHCAKRRRRWEIFKHHQFKGSTNKAHCHPFATLFAHLLLLLLLHTGIDAITTIRRRRALGYVTTSAARFGYALDRCVRPRWSRR